jgi:ribulose-phosphate 3-epimerase
MPVVAPTITAETIDEYRRQLGVLQNFTDRIHLDMMDGRFAPTRSVRLDQVWWPDGMGVDIHMMFKDPAEELDMLIELKPRLVIMHAEASGDFGVIADQLQKNGIKVGVALLQKTGVQVVAPALPGIDHVLVFSGNLGHQGGSHADPGLLHKVRRLRELKPDLEIGWDGGINAGNIRAIAEAGVEVLNVGGFIAHAGSPVVAYETLEAALR